MVKSAKRCSKRLTVGGSTRLVVCYWLPFYAPADATFGGLRKRRLKAEPTLKAAQPAPTPEEEPEFDLEQPQATPAGDRIACVGGELKRAGPITEGQSRLGRLEEEMRTLQSAVGVLSARLSALENPKPPKETDPILKQARELVAAMNHPNYREAILGGYWDKDDALRKLYTHLKAQNSLQQGA